MSLDEYFVKKIKWLSLSVERPKGEKKDPSHDGFDIDKEFMSDVSKTMTRLNASTMKLNFSKCGTMMNRDVMIAIWDFQKLTLIQRTVIWMFKKAM